MSNLALDPSALLAGAGAPPARGATPSGPNDHAAAEQALDDAIDALHTFLASEEDDQDKATVSKCLAQLQAIRGTRQKHQEAALGITDVHRGVRRAVKRGSARY